MTSYLIEHVARARPDQFIERLIGAALEVRATQPDASRSRQVLIDP